MFMNADIVVKAVMVGLAFASVLSWTIWLAKALELVLARARLRRALQRLAEARSLADALADLQGVGGEGLSLARAADKDHLALQGVGDRVLQIARETHEVEYSPLYS